MWSVCSHDFLSVILSCLAICNRETKDFFLKKLVLKKSRQMTKRPIWTWPICLAQLLKNFANSFDPYQDWEKCILKKFDRWQLKHEKNASMQSAYLFACWHYFHAFVVICQIFSKYIFSKNSFRNTIRVPSSLSSKLMFSQSWYGSKLFAKFFSSWARQIGQVRSRQHTAQVLRVQTEVSDCRKCLSLWK